MQYLANASEEMPNFPGLDVAGWFDEARTAAGYQDEAHHRLLVDALRKAGPDEADLAALSKKEN